MPPQADAECERNPTTALVLGWLIPGAGHWYIGKKRKAIFFLVMLTLTFLVGFAMGEFRNVSAARHPYYFFGQSFLGIPTILGSIVTSHMPPLDRPIPLEDMGTLYTCVASLLNALLFLDAYELAERKRLGLEPAREKTA